LIIAVSAAELATGLNNGNQEQSIDIPYNDVRIKARVFNFNLYTNRGTVIVTAARLEYFGAKNNPAIAFNNEAFNPAGVIDARYQVDY
jgi:hypothetical protein